MSSDSDAPITQITTDPNDGDRSKIVPANNPYLQKISQMKPEIGQYLLKDKMGLFCGVSDPDKVYGVLQSGIIGDTMHIQHKGDWFDAIALKLTTKLVTDVKEGFYEVSLFQGDNVIHHTGLKFHSEFTKQTFLFDVQSFCSDLSFTPIFREEPNPPYKYHPIGHVYLSQGLLELLSQIKSQKYGAMDNCRDSLVSALVICQFWNASLGIPQCLKITEAISFMKEVMDHDHWLLWYLTFGLYSNSKAEERRKEVFGLLDQLAAFSFYDDSIAKMKELGILGEVHMFQVDRPEPPLASD